MKAISFTGRVPVRGEFITELPECPETPNCVCSQNSVGDHSIEPFEFAGEPDVSWRRLNEIIGQLGGEIADEERDGYARYVFRSRIFGYVDDLEILLNKESNRIEVRSASRSGYSDLGVNRKRVETIRKKFLDS